MLDERLDSDDDYRFRFCGPNQTMAIPIMGLQAQINFRSDYSNENDDFGVEIVEHDCGGVVNLFVSIEY